MCSDAHSITLNNFQQNEATFAELDRPFSRDEICAAIKKLGNNKACSTDNMLYEYFKVCSDIIARPMELLLIIS